jgi:transcriptional regulator with XRE-family HTH domain
MYGDPVTTSVAQVAGANARKLRLAAGMTLDEFALSARYCGLPWSSGRVGDFEAGRVGPSLPTLYAVALALGPVSLADLFDGEGPVQINDALTVELSALRAALLGEPATGETGASRKRGALMNKATRTAITRSDKWRRLVKWARDSVDPLDYLNVDQTFREADTRMCAKLGVDREVGVAAMAKLWGRTFADERDERAGPDANAQRRGQISRLLKAELQEVINEGND